MEYTSPMSSEYDLNSKHCQVGEKFVIDITSKNSKGNRKPYGGDFWLARLTKQDEAEYTKLKNTNDEFGTYIPGVLKDNEDGSYSQCPENKIIRLI